MSLHKLLTVLFVIAFISNQCFADNRGYIKLIFANKDAIPTYQVIALRGQQTTSSYKLTFTDSNLNKVFANYTVLRFEKEYPIADSFPDDQAPAVRLRLVYKVIIDTATGKSYDGLKTSIDSVHSLSINTTVRQQPGEILTTTPDDYYKTYNPGFEAAYQHLDFVNALNAWNITTGLNCIKIGIVDEYFQQHEDLKNKINTTLRTVATTSASSSESHGNEVAGMAGAETNNNLGISSLGYNVRLQFYRWKDIFGEFRGYEGIAEAIYDGCKVVNCSWSEFYSSSLLSSSLNPDAQDVLNLAALNNVTIVAAAGNGTAKGPNATDYYYPASYDGVISVSTVGNVYDVNDPDPNHYADWKDCHREFFRNITNPNNNITYRDSFAYQHNDRVDICAPGYYVESTCNLGNGYCETGGTSLSAPMVSACVALLYSVNPFFTPAQIESYLKNNAVNLYNACIINGVSDNNNWAGKLGAGRLDAGASVQAAASNIYNGSTYCSGNALNCPIQSTFITTNATLSQSKYFYNKDITAGTSGSGYVQTSITSQTAFIATNSITLEAGFDADASTTALTQATTITPATYAYFTAYIEPCVNSNKEASPTKPSLTTNTSNSLQLYPNPATNEVHVFFTIAKDEKAIIKITNNLGITLRTKSVTSSKNGSGNAVIDIKDLPAGIYYITLTSAGSRLTKKLIKMNQQVL